MECVASGMVLQVYILYVVLMSCFFAMESYHSATFLHSSVEEACFFFPFYVACFGLPFKHLLMQSRC